MAYIFRGNTDNSIHDRRRLTARMNRQANRKSRFDRYDKTVDRTDRHLKVLPKIS